MQQSVAGPRRTGYVIAVIVFLLGVVGAVALAAVFFFGLIGLGDELDRVVGPGSEQVELEDTGTYAVFYEYESRVDGVRYSTDRDPPNIDVEVERLADGQEISVNRTRGEATYNLRHYSGEAIREFSIDEPGTYEITMTYADGSDGPEFVLAYGEGIGRSVLMSFGAFFGGGLLFCVLTLAAIAIAGTTFYRRHQFAQNQKASEAQQ